MTVSLHFEEQRISSNIFLIGYRGLLDRLNPVHRANFDPDQSCLPGTRVDLLQTILDWATLSEQPHRLLWLHGLAGSGKSSIASSVATLFYEKDILAGCFFFKRDDPELKKAESFLPTIAYRLALVFSPFQKVLLQALEISGRSVDANLPRQCIQRLTIVLYDHCRALQVGI